jgi:hypothetical protein
MKTMPAILLCALLLVVFSQAHGFTEPDYSIRDDNTPLEKSQAEKPSQTYKPETFFAKTLVEQYEFIIKIFAGKSLAGKSLQLSTDGLQRVEQRHFKSRKPLNARKGLFLRFNLHSYQYVSPARAKQVFKAYRTTLLADADEMSSKSPMLTLINGNSIFILNTSCLFSKSNLALIEKELEKAVFQGRISRGIRSIKRHCGGSLE